MPPVYSISFALHLKVEVRIMRIMRMKINWRFAGFLHFCVDRFYDVRIFTLASCMIYLDFEY